MDRLVYKTTSREGPPAEAVYEVSLRRIMD